MSERIIIAEDDEDLAFVLREALRRPRYGVDVAPTAGGMLDGLKASPYDLIRLDVRLPDMDGLDAIPRCRGERRMILDALQQTQGVQARAAKTLGVSERSLWYRVKKLGIQVRTSADAPPA